jgi:hypothetical protein
MRRTTALAVLVAGGLVLTAQAAHADYSTTVRNETLIVTGNRASDTLVLRVRANAPESLEGDVGDDGSADFTVARDRFERIRVRAGAGNDRVRIDESQLVFTDDTPTTVDGQRGNDTLLGGAGAETLIGGRGVDLVDGNRGDDVAVLGTGADRFVWDPGDGSDSVRGRGGRDVLAFNGSGAAETFGLSANGARARLTRNVGAITMDLTEIERVDVAALGGDDTLALDDLAATSVRTVNADLTGTLGGVVGDGRADRAIVNAGGRNDDIVVAGSAGSATVTGLAATLNLAHAEAATDSLTVNALGGNDRVSAATLARDTMRLTADGGPGSDTLLGSVSPDVLLGGDGNDAADGNGGNDVALLGAGDDRFTWDPGDGSDVVEGQAGTDAMTFNGSNAAEIFDVSANGNRVRFFRNVAAVTMDLDDVERIDTLALGGADTVAVHDLTSTDLRDVRTDLAGVLGSTTGDGQIDRMIVDATNGNDTMRVAGGGGTVDLTGLAATVGLAHAEADDALTVNGLGGADTLDASGLAPNTIALTFNQ